MSVEVKVKSQEIDPMEFGIMDLNFGQHRSMNQSDLSFCTVEFPEVLVLDYIEKSFDEIRTDPGFHEDWDEKWETLICNFATYEAFKQDPEPHVVSLIDFMAYDLLNQLILRQHMGQKDPLSYVLCGFIKNNVRFPTQDTIQIAGLCFAPKRPVHYA